MAKKKQPVRKRFLEIIISKINFTNIFLALITGGFGYMSLRISNKQDETKLQQDSTVVKIDSSNIKLSMWRASRQIKDSLLKADIDTIKEQNKLIVSLLKKIK